MPFQKIYNLSVYDPELVPERAPLPAVDVQLLEVDRVVAYLVLNSRKYIYFPGKIYLLAAGPSPVPPLPPPLPPLPRVPPGVRQGKPSWVGSRLRRPKINACLSPIFVISNNSPHVLSPCRSEAAGVVRTHDPSVLGSQLEDLEVGVASLQGHATTVP